MFAMTKRADHDHRRRLVSGAFKKSTLVSSDALCEILTRVLYGQLSPCIEDQSVHGRHIEVYDLSRAYAMDVFTNYQYGLQLGTRFIQDVEQRRWYFSRYAKVRPYLFQMSEIPGVAALVTRSGLAVISRSTHAALCELEAWNLALCDKAEALIIGDSIPCVPTENAEYPAIYAQIRAAIHQSYDIDPRPDQPTTAVRQAVASEMFDYNLGAHETSGNTLTSLLFELSRNPDIQEKLRQQLRTFLPPKGTVLTPINLKDLDSCPYLDAVILETLRFWPATPCGRPRLSPSACSLASHDLPAGVEIYHYPYSLHRNERVFPEPEVWNPERWILSSQDQLTRMRKSLFSFGGGYRMCIGNHFAMLCE
jgi:cytochrome P450